MCDKKVWNSLELIKLLVSAFIPIVLVLFTTIVTLQIKSYEKQQIKQEAVYSISRAIYERRTRSSMLSSSLKRKAPIEEVKKRKNEYDDTYLHWNRERQVHQFLVRSVLDEVQYTTFENVFREYLINRVFSPLDKCLTDAYDSRLVEESGVLVEEEQSTLSILNDCNSRQLLIRALECGESLTNELYKLTLAKDSVNYSLLEEKLINSCTGHPVYDPGFKTYK